MFLFILQFDRFQASKSSSHSESQDPSNASDAQDSLFSEDVSSFDASASNSESESQQSNKTDLKRAENQSFRRSTRLASISKPGKRLKTRALRTMASDSKQSLPRRKQSLSSREEKRKVRRLQTEHDGTSHQLSLSPNTQEHAEVLDRSQ